MKAKEKGQYVFIGYFQCAKIINFAIICTYFKKIKFLHVDFLCKRGTVLMGINVYLDMSMYKIKELKIVHTMREDSVD